MTRLIGLPEVPGHGKTGIGKWSFFSSSLYIPYYISDQLLYSGVVAPD